MARITHDGQSFLIDNRRVWLIGAGIEYARVPAELWGERIAAARQAGFNTIVTSCPWLIHEPRKGRFDFTGGADLRRFLELCIEQGLYVGLRAGPYVDGLYDGGGLPSWLREVEDVRLREPNDAYLERVGMYLRKLLSQVTDLQVGGPQSGGVIYFQAEHAWECTNDEVAEAYLGEIARHFRENGVTVPIVSANNLWAEAKRSIETWNGWDSLLVNLRQLRIIHPDQPRLVGSFESSDLAVWGDPFEDSRPADLILNHLAQVLAAGAQPMLAPFHGGTNFGFIGGRIPGRTDGYICTTPFPMAPLGEAGARGEKYDRVKRLATFAAHFGPVFAELDPDYQPVTVSLDQVSGEAPTAARKAGGNGVAIVPLRGAQGRVVFVFGDPRGRNQSTTLLLDHGLPMPVELGDQSVAWFVIDVDLGGRALLDYANLCPFALVDRRILVLFGPEKARAHISLNESLIEDTVPSGQKPKVVQHQDVTIVICSQKQIDATYVDDKKVYVGAAGLDRDGAPLPCPGFSQITVIGGESGTETIKAGSRSRNAAPTRLNAWVAAPAGSQADGTNPRYATLDGPETLDGCGTPRGYGWYRVKLRVSNTKKRACALPQVGNRMLLYVDGELQHIVGTGPDAEGHFFDLRLAKGEHTLVGLVDHLGRFSGGNDFGRRKGWYGHIYEVKTLRTSKPKVIDAEPVNPFAVRSFLLGQNDGRMTTGRHAMWSFTYRRKSPLIVAIENVRTPGVFLVNDEPVAWYAGESGETCRRWVIQPTEMEVFKRGGNELRFAPDADHPEGAERMIEGMTIYECAESLTKDASWSFARWETPADDAYDEYPKTEMKKFRGAPCWWKTTFSPRDTDLPLWFDTEGLSKGQVFLNGHNLGRYFTATATGRKIGPQTRLYLPECWIEREVENELVVFDEHGCDPAKTRIEYRQEPEFG